MKRLIACLFAAWAGVSTAADDFDRRCTGWLPDALAPTASTGVVIVDATLRAYVPAEMVIGQAVAVLSGIGGGLGIHNSAYQCSDFIVMPGLTPGRYRLVSIEGRVSSLTLSRRFLYPLPNDGYQIVNPHDWREGPQLYRVQPRRAPELEVDVRAGAVSYFGALDVVRAQGSSQAVRVERRADAQREQQARDRLARLAAQAPATGASRPAAPPPAAAAP
jgi:hypothetical protein